MAVRVISSVLAIPLLLFFIIAGGIPLLFALSVISLLGMYEIYRAVSGKIKPVHFVGFLTELVYVLWLYYQVYAKVDNPVMAVLPLGWAPVVVLAILVFLVFGHNSNNIIDGAITLFGFFYIGVLLSLICFIREYCGIVYSWLPFIFAFGCDTGAYFVGSKLGKHKLCPVLSPKKSVEGAIGGLLSSALLTGIYFVGVSLVYPGSISVMGVLYFVVVSVLGAGFSQIGDLAASSIKRFTGIKDYGSIMPGHGGVMDRFDSVLFTLPVVLFATIIYKALFFI